MNASSCLVLIVASSLLVSCACQTPKKEAKSGGDFLFALHQKGQLPGDASDEHGKISCYLAPEDLKQVTYPLFRSYQVVKTGRSFTNNYTIVRPTKDSSWQIERAWRTDSQGQVTEEWTVK